MTDTCPHLCSPLDQTSPDILVSGDSRERSYHSIDDVSDRHLLKRELGRFFSIAAEYHQRSGRSAMMPRCVVDSMWHQLISQPDELNAIIKEYVGVDTTIDHAKSDGEGELPWAEIYHARFGELPRIWFISPEGMLNKQALNIYEHTGTLRMSWDCTPAFNDKRAS